jgi:hypothetical protein
MEVWQAALFARAAGEPSLGGERQQGAASPSPLTVRAA